MSDRNQLAKIAANFTSLTLIFMPTCGSADDPRRPDMSFAYVDEYLRRSDDQLHSLPKDTLDFVWRNLSPELQGVLARRMSGAKWEKPKP